MGRSLSKNESIGSGSMVFVGKMRWEEEVDVDVDVEASPMEGWFFASVTTGPPKNTVARP